MPFVVQALFSMMIAVTPIAPSSTSYYPIRLEDAKAVYLTPDKFSVHGDGIADDSDAIQKAVDRVQETTGQGILFIPSGRYRLTKTITVWPGVRLIGYGAKRPVFLLGENTPGYQDTERFMVFFAGRRGNGATEQPTVPPEEGLKGGDFGVANEANPGTFYSALSNVDFEIQGGNPGAVAIRGRYAQHCYLAHIDFQLGDALAGIHDTGNSADDLRFFGGQYGLITRTPSPGWQFTLLDSHFEGQKKAAIRTHETGLTLIRPSFKSVPTAVWVEPGETEQLFIKGGRMEDISGPAIEFDREKSLRNQLNVEDVTCHRVPVFAHLRESGKRLTASGETYQVTAFSHGLHYNDLGSVPAIETRFEAKKLAGPAASRDSDVPALPAQESWVNLMSLGAKGDGTTDDTAVLKDAIAKYWTIYLPQGKYRVTDTIALRPDTVLIGLHPFNTQILITDGTPGFLGVGEAETAGRRGRSSLFAGGPKALLETPQGGSCVVTGIGLDSGGNNPAAVAAKWMAGAHSMMDDVKFIGGHGSGTAIYNNNNSADPNAERRWDSQYPSLWVTNGGGGTFKNIWTASTFAQAGMMVSDTTTEGRVYEMSSEHHVRHEIQVRNASNWHFYALQTEEERGEGPFCLPLDIENSSNVTIANLNMYRVVSVTQPFAQAVRVAGSKDIRFRGVHCYSNSKASFDNLLVDASSGYELRHREFAHLDLSGVKLRLPSYSRVHKLASGFFNISGGAVHPNGDFYFVDAKWQRIYKWDAGSGEVSVVQDAPLTPVNLVFDKAGNLMVVAYAGKGTVYAFKPGSSEFKILNAVPATARPGLAAALPVTDWQLNPNVVAGKTQVRPWQFVSPDGSTFVSVGQDFVDGTLTWGVKLQDAIRSFGFAKVVPGQPFYVMGESEMRTFAVDVQADGSLAKGRLFAEQGGEGLAVDSHGNVYIAAGQIYVYSPDGKLIDTIEVPERPTQLAFGGKDGKTLFITARTSLYSVKVK